MNHDEMYFNFETIGKEIFLFFKTGRFSENAQKNNLKVNNVNQLLEFLLETVKRCKF